jgi:serine/threonine protein kinase
LIGQRLSHYEIIAKLGEGGGGVVYKARDTRLDRFVAIKALNAATALDPERRLRFVHEARAASALNHPGIVAVHEIATVDGADFIVMEFVDGVTLDQVIRAGGLRLPIALNYATQIANVLGKAHAAKIVHRDIKPSNIIVTHDGVVKVLDFGVAKLSSAADDAIDGRATTHTRTLPATGSGRVFGTLAYMSPEQAAGAPVDARSDIFSFGAVLYEMVTGRPAFGGDSPTAILAAVMSSEPHGEAQLSERDKREHEGIIGR